MEVPPSIILSHSVQQRPSCRWSHQIYRKAHLVVALQQLINMNSNTFVSTFDLFFKVFCADYPFSSISHQSTALCLLFFSRPTRRVHHQMSARAAFSLSCPWCSRHQNRHWHDWGAFFVFIYLILSSVFQLSMMLLSTSLTSTPLTLTLTPTRSILCLFFSIFSLTSFSSFSLRPSSCQRHRHHSW